MGKIEKVVVLSVLLLMVVIFVVLPTGSKKTVEASDKTARVENTGGRLRSNNDVVDLGSVGSGRLKRKEAAEHGSGNAPRRPKLESAKNRSTDKTEGLLSAPVRTNVKTRTEDTTRTSRASTSESNSKRQVPGPSGLVKPTLQPVQKPALNPSWTLVRVDGLKDTINPAYKTYASRKGDTFKSLAQRFYGDKRHEQFLRRNNEGLSRLKEGQIVLMPCVNGAPLGKTYTVCEGDSLWKISKSQYNAGHRWKEIYDANRHVMKSPDDLSLGMELMIP